MLRSHSRGLLLHRKDFGRCFYMNRSCAVTELSLCYAEADELPVEEKNGHNIESPKAALNGHSKRQSNIAVPQFRKRGPTLRGQVCALLRSIVEAFDLRIDLYEDVNEMFCRFCHKQTLSMETLHNHD